MNFSTQKEVKEGICDWDAPNAGVVKEIVEEVIGASPATL